MTRTDARMNFIALALAIILPVAFTGREARAQDEGKGFRYSKPKAAPKVVTSAKVHRDRDEVTILDSWIVKQSSRPSASQPQTTAIVEDIVLDSTGTMHWKFAIFNKSSANKVFILDFPRCYVVDEQGDTYKATAWDQPQNYGTMTKLGLAAEAKTYFTLGFPAPARATKHFKVALIMEGGFSTAPNDIAPFRVTLANALSMDSGKPEPKEEPGPEPLDGLKLDDTAEGVTDRPGGMTKLPEPRPVSPPKPSSEAAQLVRAAPRDGRRYEGSIKSYAGGESAGGILFERRSKDRLLSARIFTKTIPAREIKLVGAIYEEIAAPGGLVFRFEDRDEVEYLFKVEGDHFAGTDSRGGRYSFMYRK